jgi:hypothetical protein
MVSGLANIKDFVEDPQRAQRQKKRCQGCQPGKPGRGFMVHYTLEITVEAVEIFTTLSITVQS